jgi:peptidyl-prolyl cis-trans isomerase C
MNFRLAILNSLIGLLLTGVAGCTWNNSSNQKQVVAKVESIELNSKQFAEELAHRLSKYDALTAKDPQNVTRVKDSIISDFMMSAILTIWAQKSQIQVNRDTLDKELASIRDGFPDDLTFREELSKQRLSLSEWKQQVEKRLLEKTALEKIQQRVADPTDQEIVRYFEIHKKKYDQPEKIYLQQIVLSTRGDADQIQSALKKKQTFESLAKEFSVTPEGKNGGIVGWVERGTLEIFDKAFELPMGRPSETIQSPYGFHIMLVLKRTPASPATLENARASIKRELKAQGEQTFFTSWLEQQIRSVHVFKDQILIEKMAVETRKEQ